MKIITIISQPNNITTGTNFTYTLPDTTCSAPPTYLPTATQPSNDLHLLREKKHILLSRNLPALVAPPATLDLKNGVHSQNSITAAQWPKKVHP